MGPLDGVRVLDVAGLLAGQYCTRIMADLGAEVIKIELGPAGDPLRATMGDGSQLFPYANAGKKSLCLKAPPSAALEVVEELSRQADVLVESFVPGLDDAWRGDYGGWQAANPRLIVGSVTPFGRTGPLRDHPGSEVMMQALAGTAFMTGEPGGPPFLTSNGFPYTMTGLHACIGIVQALLHRESTGRGQGLDVAMLDTVFALDCENVPFVSAERGRYLPEALGRSAFADTLAVYRAKEGYLVIEVWGRGPESMWGRLARAMDREELIADPRFVDDQARVRNMDQFRIIIEGWLARFDSDEAAISDLISNKVVSGRVLTPSQTIAHPQMHARRMVREFPQSDGSSLPIMATPYKFSRTPIDVGPPPMLGEHNREILGALLGYDDERIDQVSSRVSPDQRGMS